MATYQADRAQAEIQPRELHAGAVPFVASFTVSTALAENDVIEMVKVPAGATVVDLWLSAEDLDTGATPSITLDVGDGDDTDRYLAGSTIGQAGGFARMDTQTGAGHSYAAEDTIDVLVSAAVATGATDVTVKLGGFYTMDA